MYITDDQMFDMLGLRAEENEYAHVEPNDDASGPNNGGIDTEDDLLVNDYAHVEPVHVHDKEKSQD